MRIFRSILTLFAVAVFFGAIVLAQMAPSSTIPKTPTHNWQDAKLAGASSGKLFVITGDQPDHKQSCRIKSFTAEKLVCSVGIGRTRTYLPHQVTALILPGYSKLHLVLVMLGDNGGGAAAIWGTVVLAASCPACAAATAFAASVLLGDNFDPERDGPGPNRLLYLAPGGELSSKLGHVEQ